jgi:hypothetical protein
MVRIIAFAEALFNSFFNTTLLVALNSTTARAEMSTMNLPVGKGRAAREAGVTLSIHKE